MNATLRGLAAAGLIAIALAGCASGFGVQTAPPAKQSDEATK